MPEDDVVKPKGKVIELEQLVRVKPILLGGEQVKAVALTRQDLSAFKRATPGLRLFIDADNR